MSYYEKKTGRYILISFENGTVIRRSGALQGRDWGILVAVSIVHSKKIEKGMVIMKGKRLIKKKLKYILTLVVIVAVGVFGYLGNSVQAADEIGISLDGVLLDPTATYEMKTSSIQLMMETSGISYDDKNKYDVRWTIEDSADGKENDIASIKEGTSQTIGILTAKSPGDVTITVTVYDKTQVVDGAMAQLGSATCKIKVIFAVDTTKDDSKFKYVNESDTDRSLVLYSNDSPVSLDLNFGDPKNTQWTSMNPEVAVADRTSGEVTPKGAGKTQIVATYTVPAQPTVTYTAYLDVYVIPRVSKDKNATPGSGGAADGFSKILDAQMESGDFLYTDTDFSQNMEVIRSKVIWVVTKDVGGGYEQVIANSLGMESDLITLTPSGSRSNELQVTGIAGEYKIYFYPYGSYTDENNKSNAWNPITTVNLTIYSNMEDNKKEILSIGDQYNFAEAYNMTTEDFLDIFDVDIPSSSVNYATYNSATGILTTKAEGMITATIRMKKGKAEALKKLANPAKITLPSPIPERFSLHTTLEIVDRIYLDRSNITLSVGQEYQLNLVANSTYSGPIQWTSSDPRYVSVNESGLIKGLRVTEEGKDVTITATLDAGDGVYKTATCLVKVEQAVNGFTLSPNTDQTMLVGEHITVVANIKQTVTVAPLTWECSNANNPVFRVEPAADGKSAIITALRTGTADLIVQNTLNKNDKRSIRITVRSAIQSISFNKAELSVELYKETYNMKKEVTYAPANATDTSLTWVSSDTSVATIDEDGVLTLAGGGTTLISVYPTYNPYNVMASCVVTVIGSATELVLDKTDLLMNVGDSETITIDYVPKNTTAQLVWKAAKDNIVDIAWDEERKLTVITAKGPGETDVNITSPQVGVNTIHVNVKQPASAIAITPKSVVVRTGDTAQLKAVLTPANSTDRVEWTSMDTSIVRVNETGVITGIKSGTAFVRAQAFNGKIQGPIETVQVIVRDGITGVRLDAAEKVVNVGSSITVTPIFTPETAYDKTMKWTIANTNIAKVEASGTSNAKVTGVSVGTTMLVGTASDGGFTVACLIRVNPKAEDQNTKVTVSPTSKFMKVGKTFYVKATVTGTPNKKVKWKTSKKKVATVSSSGKVKAKKLGTAYITATAKDGSGAFARCKVRVVRMAKKLRLNKYNATVLVGDTLKLKAKITPKNATVKKVKWSTSDKTIAEVDSTGRVLGVAEGIVKIKAKTTDGSKKTATCIVKVREPVEATGVTVADSEITIAKGRARQSGIVASPVNTTTKIRYYSDNKKVATVDKRGKIRSKRVGQATIYGETANHKRGYCDVLVVDLNRKGLKMRMYDTEQLRVNEISEGVTWYSKNINVATVDASGLVTGRKRGTTTIYAIVNGIKLGCRVRIRQIR